MATKAERNRLRRDIGATEAALSNVEADELFAEAGEGYTEGTGSYYAQTRVLALRGLLASSAKLTTYKQNQSSENMSDVFKHLKELLAYWEKALTAQETAVSGSGPIRGSKRLSRLKEYPGQ